MKKLLKGVLIVIVGLVVLGVLVGGDDTPTTVAEQPETEQEELPLVITAEEILKEYEDNEITAHEKYKDKIVEVTGVIDNFQVVFNKNVVYINYEGAPLLQTISCKLKEGVDVSSYAKGDTITLVGEVGNYTVTQLSLEDCAIK